MQQQCIQHVQITLFYQHQKPVYLPYKQHIDTRLELRACLLLSELIVKQFFRQLVILSMSKTYIVGRTPWTLYFGLREKIKLRNHLSKILQLKSEKQFILQNGVFVQEIKTQPTYHHVEYAPQNSVVKFSVTGLRDQLLLPKMKVVSQLMLVTLFTSRYPNR